MMNLDCLLYPIEPQYKLLAFRLLMQFNIRSSYTKWSVMLLREKCIDIFMTQCLLVALYSKNFQGSPFKMCYVASVDSFLPPSKHTFPHLTSSSFLIGWICRQKYKHDLDIFNCCGYAADLSSEWIILCTRILIYLNVIYVCVKKFKEDWIKNCSNIVFHILEAKIAFFV